MSWNEDGGEMSNKELRGWFVVFTGASGVLSLFALYGSKAYWSTVIVCCLCSISAAIRHGSDE